MVQLVAKGVGVGEDVGGVEGAGRDYLVGLGATGCDLSGEEGQEGRGECVGGVDDASGNDAN